MTRLLSNVIKSKDVYLNEKNIKKINPDFAFSSKAGKHINSTNSNEVITDNKTNNEKNNQVFMNFVKDQAKSIIENAEKDAKKISTSIYSDAKENGYQEGIKAASLKIEELENELNLKLKQNQEEYEKLIKDIEPQVARIVIDLLGKITGVVIKNNHVVEHLIRQTLLGSDKSKSYFIRVSEEEYRLVSEKKEQFEEIVGRDTEIEFAIDKDLKKDQCLIETDSGIIDCSLDVQLNNLYESIRLLAGT